MTLLFGKSTQPFYNEDKVLNSKNKWYWKWQKDNIIALHSKCAICSTTLVYDENKINNVVHFYCPNCNSEAMSVKGGNFEYSQLLIKREIKRKAFPELFKKVS